MKASECKCIERGKQAVAFWPVIDPDIQSHPYCRECLDKDPNEAWLDKACEWLEERQAIDLVVPNIEKFINDFKKDMEE